MRWRQTVNRWRAAEASRDEPTAEKTLFEVFGLLSDPAPPPGFAAAVLRRLAAAPMPAPMSAAVPWALRWAVAAAMIATAYSVVALPFALRSLGDFIQVSSTVELVSAALVTGSAALASWLELWQSLAELDRVLLDIVSKPHVAAPLVATLGISLAALLLVSRLTASDRSRDYV